MFHLQRWYQARWADASLCLSAMQRQRLMVQQFYTEVGSLEEVMEEAAYALGDEAYSVLNQASHSKSPSTSLLTHCHAGRPQPCAACD